MSEWISVKERVPINSSPVLVFSKNIIIKAYYYNKYENWYSYPDFDSSYTLDHITHWMELPEPPK